MLHQITSLQDKGCLKIITVEERGTRIRLRLPSEIDGVVPIPTIQSIVSIDEMDFFAIPENRDWILIREDFKCFYCLREIRAENHVIEHVVSRPLGDSSFRNVVAACRQCNNRKGDTAAMDFFRALYREGYLSDAELQQRLDHLTRLRAGELRPIIIKRMKAE